MPGKSVQRGGLDGEVVLVTGCSSGIGKAAALELDRLGFRVYAGVRRESNAAELRSIASSNLQPVILDVTVEDQIDAVLEQLTENHADEGIHGLVNVAGVADFGKIEIIDSRLTNDSDIEL